MHTMAGERDTKLYVSFNIPSQKHVITHAHSILWLVWSTYTLTHVELRLNWTLKGECQFYVKSLFLFLFIWVWDSAFSILTKPRAHLHSLIWRVRKYRYDMYIYILYMNWTRRSTEISRMLMQSLKKKEERYYTI
jgi:phosphatidylserine/phosphatidylglycerophosphate/cardiolipin synthase-like enzyme